jgi:hypothetical protein
VCVCVCVCTRPLHAWHLHNMPTCRLSVTQPRLTVTPVMGIRPLSETSLSEDLAVFAIQNACPYSPRTCSVITMGAAGWGRQVKDQMQMQAAD